ncbi:MAG: hypothetical protein AVDCRST_MAG12-1110, partial [uncultured Rubrobacteraceae bacterium]
DGRSGLPRRSRRAGEGPCEARLLPEGRVALHAGRAVEASGTPGGVRREDGRGRRRPGLSSDRRVPRARPNGSVLPDGEEVRPVRQVVRHGLLAAAVRHRTGAPSRGRARRRLVEGKGSAPVPGPRDRRPHAQRAGRYPAARDRGDALPRPPLPRPPRRALRRGPGGSRDRPARPVAAARRGFGRPAHGQHGRAGEAGDLRPAGSALRLPGNRSL